MIVDLPISYLDSESFCPTWFFFFLFLKIYYLFIYLFGCIGSQLRHTGSSLWCAGLPLVVLHRLLSSCGVWVFLFSSCGVQAQLPRIMWDLSSLSRYQTHVPCIVRCILYPWTTREVPALPVQRLSFQITKIVFLSVELILYLYELSLFISRDAS